MSDNDILIFPYSKVVGHSDLKRALEIAYIADTRLGGVLVSGHRGTGKSTIVRAFTRMMYDDLPITLPINATEDRVVGGWQIENLMEGSFEKQTGLLQDANGKILYIDEVNLLDDHIVNIILDTAATGILTVQRQGLDISEKTRFTLVGTMNPEEGHLRPQLRDRFGLMAHIMTQSDQRAKILQRVLAFDKAVYTNGEESDFLQDANSKNNETKAKLETAREEFQNITMDVDVAQGCVDLATAFEVIGHRADYYLALAAQAQAARKGADEVSLEHLRDVAPLVLTHRRENQNERWLVEDNQRVADLLDVGANRMANLSTRVVAQA